MKLNICKQNEIKHFKIKITPTLREPKHVRTRGTDSKLESDERKLRDGT